MTLNGFVTIIGKVPNSQSIWPTFTMVSEDILKTFIDGYMTYIYGLSSSDKEYDLTTQSWMSF